MLACFAAFCSAGRSSRVRLEQPAGGAPVLANSRNAPNRFGAAARRQYSLLDKEYLDCFIRHPLPSSCYNC